MARFIWLIIVCALVVQPATVSAQDCTNASPTHALTQVAGAVDQAIEVDDGFSLWRFGKGLLTGGAVGFVVGTAVVTVAAVVTAPAWVTAAVVGGAVAAAGYGIYAVARDWDEMTGGDKSELAGELIGGLATGGFLAARAGSAIAGLISRGTSSAAATSAAPVVNIADDFVDDALVNLADTSTARLVTVSGQSEAQALVPYGRLNAGERRVVDSLLARAKTRKYNNRARAALQDDIVELFGSRQAFEDAFMRKLLGEKLPAALDDAVDDIYTQAVALDRGLVESAMVRVVLKDGTSVQLPMTSSRFTSVETTHVESAIQALLKRTDVDPADVLELQFFHVHPSGGPLSLEDLIVARQLHHAASKEGIDAPFTMAAVGESQSGKHVFQTTWLNPGDDAITTQMVKAADSKIDVSKLSPVERLQLLRKRDREFYNRSRPEHVHVGGGPEVKLGLDHRLGDLPPHAVSYKGDGWRKNGLTGFEANRDGEFTLAFWEAMRNTNHIHVALDGLDLPRAVASGQTVPKPGQITSWEFLQVVSEPVFRNKATFYFGGRAHTYDELIANPAFRRQLEPPGGSFWNEFLEVAAQQ